MITTDQLKNGLTIELEGELYTIIEYQHVKPGKGGAFVRTKLKNLRTKNMVEKTFRGGERLQEAFIEEKKIQYLYKSTHLYHFMDQENYEEIMLDENKLSKVIDFLKENMEITAVFYQNKVIEVKLPIFVELKVVTTEPGVKGDTAKSAFKPAQLESGATIQVPLFIEQNDIIKIDTRTSQYVERA